MIPEGTALAPSGEYTRNDLHGCGHDQGVNDRAAALVPPTFEPDSAAPEGSGGGASTRPLAISLSDDAKTKQGTAVQPPRSTGRLELTAVAIVVSGGRGSCVELEPIEQFAARRCKG